MHFYMTLLFSILLLQLGKTQCSGPTCDYYINGADAGTYTVTSGQKICLDANANFTGTINLHGGTLENCATAVQSFTLDTDSGSPNAVFINNGSVSFGATHSFTDAIVINNYGMMNFGNELHIDGNAFYNNYDSTIVVGLVDVSANLNNEGVLIAGGKINGQSTSDITNSGYLEATEFDIRNTWINSGTVEISGLCNFQSSSSGTISGGCMTCNDFSNRSTINGTTCGNITINNNSSQTSTGVLSGDIAIIDLTPPPTAPYIDSNNGTVGPDIVWTSCTSCTAEICNNSIDDDGDTLIDCLDPDCNCCQAQAPSLSK